MIVKRNELEPAWVDITIVTVPDKAAVRVAVRWATPAGGSARCTATGVGRCRSTVLSPADS